MQKQVKSIEIVRSSNTALSSMSLRSSNALFELLSKYYTDVRVTTIVEAPDLLEIAERKPDLVFLTVKYVPLVKGQKRNDPAIIWVTDFLDSHHIAYTGSNQKAHMLELNKPLAKQCAIDAGLNTSAFHLVHKSFSFMPIDSTLRYPLFIKPSDRGGGLGVDNESIAHNLADAELKLASIAANFQADALVEEYLTGHEFSVGILKKITGSEYFLMPIELESEGTIMSNQVKHEDAETVLPVTNPLVRKTICTLALNIFKALGARDYGRIDIRMDAHGIPQFLEANLIPSLIENYGSFPKACVMNEQIDYEDMILRIVRLAFARGKTTSFLPMPVSPVVTTP